jgi:hypothetical protein
VDFDSADGKVHLFSVTSQGEANDHVSEWLNYITFEFSWKGCCKNWDLEEKIIVVWVSEDQIEVKDEDYSKGKAKLSPNYVLKRKEAAEPALQEEP